MIHTLRVFTGLVLSCVVVSACTPSPQTAATQTSSASTAIASEWTKTPTTPPTSTPTATSAFSPTPEFTDVYESKSLGVSIRYPTGWTISDDDSFNITFEKENRHLVLYFYPADRQTRNDNDPISALVSYIQFVGYALPDEESVHLITLNDSEVAIGAYSKPGEAVGFNNPSPLFIAMRFTKEYTIAAEFFASSKDDVIENRKIFEMVLTSLPPSPSGTAEATATLAPNATLDSSKPPTETAIPTETMEIPAEGVPEGGLLVDDQLRYRVFEEFWAWSILNGCNGSILPGKKHSPSPDMVTIEVLEQPDSSGKWKERWAFRSLCKAKSDIVFTPNTGGGVDWILHLSEQ